MRGKANAEMIKALKRLGSQSNQNWSFEVFIKFT